MICRLTILLVQVIIGLTAPLQFPLVHLQGTMQQQQLALQEQMLALQQFQAMQRFNSFPPPVPMSPQQPILILLPDTRSSIKQDDRLMKLNENTLKKKPSLEESSEGIVDEEAESITIDADSQDDLIENSDNNIDNNIPMKGILLVPNNARFSIGGIISAIPFLPFEINVPDSISWIYNGISGIISGIGQSWPFRPNADQISGKLWKELKTSNKMPIVVIPLDPSILSVL